MKWKVTAFPNEDDDATLAIWLESTQQVSIAGRTRMQFFIRPFRPEGASLDSPVDQWRLDLNLMEDERTLAGKATYLYRTITDATTDAEALLAYFQDTTDAPHVQPTSLETQHPRVGLKTDP